MCLWVDVIWEKQNVSVTVCKGSLTVWAQTRLKLSWILLITQFTKFYNGFKSDHQLNTLNYTHRDFCWSNVQNIWNAKKLTGTFRSVLKQHVCVIKSDTRFCRISFSEIPIKQWRTLTFSLSHDFSALDIPIRNCSSASFIQMHPEKKRNNILLEELCYCKVPCRFKTGMAISPFIYGVWSLTWWLSYPLLRIYCTVYYEPTKYGRKCNRTIKISRKNSVDTKRYKTISLPEHNSQLIGWLWNSGK